MSGDWALGDVALVTTKVNPRAACVAVRDVGRHWVCGHAKILDDDIIEARPLVVLDPEDGEQVDRLAALIRLNGGGHPYATLTAEVASSEADAVQAALRSLVSPPKPKEPSGLGAVVEDSNGDKWVRLAPRVADFDWLNADDPNRSRAWRNVAAVRVLSEGVAS